MKAKKHIKHLMSIQLILNSFGLVSLIMWLKKNQNKHTHQNLSRAQSKTQQEMMLFVKSWFLESHLLLGCIKSFKENEDTLTSHLNHWTTSNCFPAALPKRCRHQHQYLLTQNRCKASFSWSYRLMHIHLHDYDFPRRCCGQRMWRCGGLTKETVYQKALRKTQEWNTFCCIA